MGVVGWVTLGVVLVIAGMVLWALLRFRRLCDQAGSVVCAMRLRSQDSWRTGVARFGSYSVTWWRARSLSIRPALRWQRERLTVVERFSLAEAGRPDLILVRCQYDDSTFELSMSISAYAGLASWFESAPPSESGAVL